MVEMIKAIALLCAVHTSGHYGASEIENMQISCQKLFADCVKNNKRQDSDSLLECMQRARK